jgi:hypothetical protein
MDKVRPEGEKVAWAMRIKFEQGKTGFSNMFAPASGDSFLWVLSLSVQRKYLVPSGNEKP